MTEDEWWSTPFPHKATIDTMYLNAACDWLEGNGHREWIEWNKMFLGGHYRFEFLDEKVQMAFVLRWV
jgi:hypothetical protein